MKSKSASSYDETMLRRLLAAGYPSPSALRSERPHDLVVEVTKPELTVAYDGRTGAEFVFFVRVTNRSYSRLMVHQFRARFPWTACPDWLGDPRIHVPEREVYRLPSGRTFPYDEVLNHRRGERGVLNPGENMEGFLLAFTLFDRVSLDYLHGTRAPVSLFARDQFGRKHRSEIEIAIDRTATMLPMLRRPRANSLYEDTGVRPVVFAKYQPEPRNSLGERVPLMDKTEDNSNSGSTPSGSPASIPEDC